MTTRCKNISDCTSPRSCFASFGVCLKEQTPAAQKTEDQRIEELAHRMAWLYKKSSDPHLSDTYTFNRSTLLDFARALKRMG